MSAGALRPMRRRMQVVFQDPFASLNPRMHVRDILAEPIRNFGLVMSSGELDRRVNSLLDKVRLPRDAAKRWPHEFSGGQRQRIAIARAALAQPLIVILDEATSGLDVETTLAVHRALDHSFADRTRLIITHRASDIENSDLCWRLDAGQIRPAALAGS
jgi:peptide/nickel transport system ATP-binding protein